MSAIDSEGPSHSADYSESELSALLLSATVTFDEVPIFTPSRRSKQLTGIDLGIALELLYVGGLNEGALDLSATDIRENGSTLPLLRYLLIPFVLGEVTSNLKPDEGSPFDPKYRFEALKYSLLRWDEHMKRLLRLELDGIEVNRDMYDALATKLSRERVEAVKQSSEEMLVAAMRPSNASTMTHEEIQSMGNEREHRIHLLRAEEKSLETARTEFAKIEWFNEDFEQIDGTQYLIYFHALLEWSFFASASRMSITLKELPLLAMMISRQDGSGSSTASKKLVDKNQNQMNAKPKAPTYTILPGGRRVEGVVTKTDLLDASGNQVERVVNRVGPSTDGGIGGAVDRQSILMDVFKPFYTLPTVSLAEVADWEMANETGKNAPDNSKLRTDKETGETYTAQSAYEGNFDAKNDSSDSETEDDDVVIEKRSWDDWKDENPKGSGNKMHNRA